MSCSSLPWLVRLFVFQAVFFDVKALNYPICKLRKMNDSLPQTKSEFQIERPELSLFLPVLDEEENLRPMHEKIKAALDALGKSAEVIYVDDGSTDKSLSILKEIAATDDRVRVISLRRNYGQTAAMSAGIDSARGEHPY